ncbi:glucose-6-phosphate isomerase [Sphingomicrobium flavum]|uniref:glucose-6-phosphate isomerase n=1 Tax=Sphingomicrobium flavum TaxID=1229164 RepID=UPI0021AE0225|nr:glucose-6-phosphate isomerase [Sphingomicrobium flavum]
MTDSPEASAAWSAIEQYESPRIERLFEADPGRLKRLSVEVAGMTFDWSKTHLGPVLLKDIAGLAGAMDFETRRRGLFAGEVVNPSEGRSATHVAERGQGAAHDNELAANFRMRMRQLIDAIEAEAFGPVEAVLHIGIGGSALGPALAVDALGRDSTRVQLRTVANIDGEAMDEAVRGLNPETTLIVVVSKSFTTTETLTNMDAALEWLEGAGVEDATGKIIAVTANPDKALEAGVDETRILPFADSVGGRYSLWSAVGVSIALALGWDAYEAMLEGAAEMDRHFRLAPLGENAPFVAAASDLFYVHNRGSEARAVFAYDERLRLLVPYLQQLIMESNGKSVTLDGQPLGRPSAPVIWGGVGTDAQHAVFQLLHQGSLVMPIEFVAVIENEDSQDPRQHRQLLLNAFAQGAALMTGRENKEDAARHYPGDRPSVTILLERLDARTLGALIAFYEHRTFTEAALLGINPFDQFGVELGKDMARAIDDPEARAGFDPSTRALIEKAGL